MVWLRLRKKLPVVTECPLVNPVEFSWAFIALSSRVPGRVGVTWVTSASSASRNRWSVNVPSRMNPPVVECDAVFRTATSWSVLTTACAWSSAIALGTWSCSCSTSAMRPRTRETPDASMTRSRWVSVVVSSPSTVTGSVGAVVVCS